MWRSRHALTTRRVEADGRRADGRQGPQTTRGEEVIIAGAGIGGLSCAWELMRRGTRSRLEAADRTGGHVFTFAPLDDGLYADAGAEQFTQPGYERYWGYVREFELAHRYYPRRDHMLRLIGGRSIPRRCSPIRRCSRGSG